MSRRAWIEKNNSCLFRRQRPAGEPDRQAGGRAGQRRHALDRPRDSRDLLHAPAGWCGGGTGSCTSLACCSLVPSHYCPFNSLLTAALPLPCLCPLLQVHSVYPAGSTEAFHHGTPTGASSPMPCEAGGRGGTPRGGHFDHKCCSSPSPPAPAPRITCIIINSSLRYGSHTGESVIDCLKVGTAHCTVHVVFKSVD